MVLVLLFIKLTPMFQLSHIALAKPQKILYVVSHFSVVYAASLLIKSFNWPCDDPAKLVERRQGLGNRRRYKSVVTQQRHVGP